MLVACGSVVEQKCNGDNRETEEAILNVIFTLACYVTLALTKVSRMYFLRAGVSMNTKTIVLPSLRSLCIPLVWNEVQVFF